MIFNEFQRLVYEPSEMTLANSKGLRLWLDAYASRDSRSVRELIVSYLSGETIPECLDMIDPDKREEVDELLDWFVGELRIAPMTDLISELKHKRYALVESVDNVPQLSSLEASTEAIVDVLAMSETPLTYIRLGYHLYGAGENRNEVAKRKYGENAAKFAAILGLVRLGRDIQDPVSPNRIGVELTSVGKAFARAKGDRMDIAARLLLKSALFRDLIASEDDECARVFWEVVSLLAPETRLRRTSAFSAMLGLYLRYGGVLGEGSHAEELLCRMRR